MDTTALDAAHPDTQSAPRTRRRYPAPLHKRSPQAGITCCVEEAIVLYIGLFGAFTSRLPVLGGITDARWATWWKLKLSK